jgi:hypothetical protein
MNMLRRLRIAVTALMGLAGVALVLYGLALRAMREVQPFYAAATEAEPQELKSAHKRLESRVSALSAPKPAGRWHTIFSDEEVNGWLATMLENEYAELLPPGVSDPRVAFADGVCKLGYRYDGQQFRTVVSVEGEAFMASADVAAIRFRRAWAGVLPLPMSRVVKEVSAAAKKLDIPVRWTEQDNDPVLLTPVAGALSTDEELRQLERLEVHEGELLLAGSAKPRRNDAPIAIRPVAASTGR